MSDPVPSAPANHSLANIGVDWQRTLVGVAIIGLAAASAFHYISAQDAGAAIALILGSHYITT